MINSNVLARLTAVNQQRLAAFDGGEEIGDLAVVTFVLNGRQLVVERLDFGGRRGVILRKTIFLLPACLDLPRYGHLRPFALESQLLLLAVMDERRGNLPHAAVVVGEDCRGKILHFGVSRGPG